MIKIEKKIKSKKGLLIIPVFEENFNKMPAFCPLQAKNFLKKISQAENFKGQKNKIFGTYTNASDLPEKILVCGMGKKDKFSVRDAMETGGKIGRAARDANKKQLSVLLTAELADKAEHFFLGLLLSLYQVDTFKTEHSRKEKSFALESFEVITDTPDHLEKHLKKIELISEASEYVKDLVNAPSNLVDGNYLAEQAEKMARKFDYKVAIFDQKKLQKMKWGALLAVNQGAPKEAKCIVLEYEGASNKNEKPLVLVGKGVMFDTGGYNLKPVHHIETMHQDMAGAATVLGIFSVLSRLKIKRNIIGVLPIAENMINDKAYRPSDIITSYSGKTIEITNTDAEGRLILADAITYATKLKPAQIITVATLTGAVAVALGNRFAGLMGNDLKLRKELQKAGREVDDLGWPLPLHRDFHKTVDSKIADIRNHDLSREAGSEKGGAFLARFVGKNKWCHIDIGGTAFTAEPKLYEQKGATAASLRMLIRFLMK